MVYDIVIVGSGVAGLTAGIYAGRAGKKTLIIENQILGGTTATLDTIENYPGFEKITGIELIQKMYMQVVNLGVKVEFLNINRVDFDNNKILIDGCDDIKYKALIIASGISNKKLNVENADNYLFKGISYCAICDGPLFKNKNIAVLTDGNLGKGSIDYLSNITDKLTILDVSNKYKNENTDINLYNNVKITKLLGDERLKGIEFKSDKKDIKLDVDALFVSLGKEINLSLYNKYLDIKNNFLVTDENMKTKIDNVFVAGDIRYKSLRQIVTACSDGAIATNEAIKYLNNLRMI